MKMRDPVCRPVLQHEQQSTGVALVPPVLVPEPLDRPDDAVRVGGWREADGKVEDRLGHQPGTAVEPTCSTATDNSPSAERSSAASHSNARGHPGSLSTSRTCP